MSARWFVTFAVVVVAVTLAHYITEPAPRHAPRSAAPVTAPIAATARPIAAAPPEPLDHGVDLRLKDIEDRVDALDAAAPLDPAPEPGDLVADQQRAFDADPADPSGGTAAEAALRDRLGALRAARLDGCECRATRCRLLLSAASEAELASGVDEVQALLPWPVPTFAHTVPGHDDRLIMYLPRG